MIKISIEWEEQRCKYKELSGTATNTHFECHRTCENKENSNTRADWNPIRWP